MLKFLLQVNGLEGKAGYETYRLEAIAKPIGDANSFQVPPYNSDGLIGSECHGYVKLVVDLDGIALETLELQIVKKIVVGKIAPNVCLPSPQFKPQWINGVPSNPD